MSSGVNKDDHVAMLKDISTKANLAARKAHMHSAGVKFTGVLGRGGNADVFEAEMTADVPVLSKGCARGGTTLRKEDPHPAVKVSTIKKGLGGAWLKRQREYEIAAWAHRIGVAPAVHCEATWDLGANGRYHLIFMEMMHGDLEDLVFNTDVHIHVKKLAWAFTFRQIDRVSRASPPSIGLDLKPQNVLVATDANHYITGTFLSDWDPRLWKSVRVKEEALLFNYMVFVVNTLALFKPEEGEDMEAPPDFCEQLPFFVKEFANKLLHTWRRTPSFMRYLKKWDTQFIAGLYHYLFGVTKLKALDKKNADTRAGEAGKALKRLALYYGNLDDCASSSRDDTKPSERDAAVMHNVGREAFLLASKKFE